MIKLLVWMDMTISSYKLAWPIIRDDITLAVQEFFLIRKMLKV